MQQQVFQVGPANCHKICSCRTNVKTARTPRGHELAVAAPLRLGCRAPTCTAHLELTCMQIAATQGSTSGAVRTKPAWCRKPECFQWQLGRCHASRCELPCSNLWVLLTAGGHHLDVQKALYLHGLCSVRHEKLCGKLVLRRISVPSTCLACLTAEPGGELAS